MELGIIGLGKMGFNMAERLRLAGHKVVGFDFNKEAVAKLTATGSPSRAALSMGGPPGNGRPKRRAVLSKASPMASSAWKPLAGRSAFRSNRWKRLT